MKHELFLPLGSSQTDWRTQIPAGKMLDFFCLFFYSKWDVEILLTWFGFSQVKICCLRNNNNNCPPQMNFVNSGRRSNFLMAIVLLFFFNNI